MIANHYDATNVDKVIFLLALTLMEVKFLWRYAQRTKKVVLKDGLMEAEEVAVIKNQSIREHKLH